MNPAISVVIPMYNDGSVLAACIEALQQQDFSGGFEVIVVDNGSVRDHAVLPPGDDRFRLIQESKPGSYAARNAALGMARGAVIVFTDTDCRPVSGWLSELWACFAADASVDLVAGRITLFFADPVRPTAVELYESVYAFRHEDCVRDGHAVTANLAVRAEVFQRIGRFNDTTFSGGDGEFTRRATGSGMRLVYAPDAVVLHPARRELSELTRKVRRVAGGYRSLAAVSLKHRQMLSVFSVTKLLFSPAKCALLMLRRSLKGELSPVNALRVFAVFTVVRWYDAWQRTAYLLRLKNDFERR